MLQLGQAEIEDADCPVGGQHQVGRLDIPIDQAALVDVLQPGRGLPHDLAGSGRRQRPAVLAADVGQIDAGNEVHRQDLPDSVRLARVQGADHVRVIQPPQGIDFLLKPLNRVGVGLGPADRLDGDRTMQQRMDRFVDSPPFPLRRVFRESGNYLAQLASPSSDEERRLKPRHPTLADELFDELFDPLGCQLPGRVGHRQW